LSKDFSFTKDSRITKSYDYRRIQYTGIRRTTKNFIVLFVYKNESPARLGLTVSRKVGGAVQRNRVKRLLREFFRSSRSCFPQYLDVSIIARRGASNLDLEAVNKELLPLFQSILGKNNA